MAKSTATLKIRKWGNSLAVRIPATVARTARLREGQPVEVTADGGEVRVCPVGAPQPSLERRLAQFDPDIHGGEAMPTPPQGREKWE